jgi:plasmid replication initiation protein
MSEGRQLGLFDSPLRGDVSNDRRMMVWGFFALDTSRKSMDPIVYDDGLRRIEVKPSYSGMANVVDKDFIIYIASLMREKMEKGERPAQKFTFTANDFCRVSGKVVGGSAYEQIRESIDRLQGTQIKTNIETGGEGEDAWFSWISKAKINYRTTKDGKKSMRSITVELCDWLYRAILHDDMMLTYNQRYFELAPLPRRIYEIARSHMGGNEGFRISLESLKTHVGGSTPLKGFKYLVKQLLEADSLPDFGIALANQKHLEAGPMEGSERISLKDVAVIFWRRSSGKPADFTTLPFWNPEL